VNTSYTGEIEAGCLQLFNELCEHKALLPLAYLLHTWPAPCFTDNALLRLRKTLEAVSSFSEADLTSTGRELCERLILKLELCDLFQMSHH
jgi:hypothetical protein